MSSRRKKTWKIRRRTFSTQLRDCQRISTQDTPFGGEIVEWPKVRSEGHLEFKIIFIFMTYEYLIKIYNVIIFSENPPKATATRKS